MTKKTESVDKKDKAFSKADKLLIAFGVSCGISSLILYLKGIISLTTLMSLSLIPMGLINFFTEIVKAS